ncbi:mechanosensitive ion channel [Sphingomonas sp. ID1715]|uniref:mechanosensitive ion channel family protein n=1 Tax=Sphingomonas sp. ID1715 TaxID=1656898 RepID=UPI001488DC84|nr:mechanosensitive ion channel domain-containing protein [Sphingomonas sp. ID1715]NNM78253.1 mechanosensitive ion channel [Sphingomonas sp. ID1715]
MTPGERPSVRQQMTDMWDGTSLWFQQHFLEILVGVAAGAVIVIVMHALRRLGSRLCERDRSGTGWATVFGRAIDKTSNLFILAAAAKLVDGYAQPPEMVQQTIDFVFTVAAVIQVAIWAREIVIGFVEHRTTMGEHEALGSAMNIIRLLVSIVLFVLAGVVILDNLGVNVTGLVAGLGIGGIAIGLAAQGIFADLFAALSILFDRPFRRGDSIAYDQTSGTVEAIGLKSTRLRSISGEQRVISNKNLLDKEIRNNTRLDHRRGKFALGLVSQLSPDQAARVPALLKEIVEGQGLHFVRAGFVGFGASSLDYELEYDVPSADYQVFYDARTALGMAIMARFAAERLDFAFPTQVSLTGAPDGRLIMPYPDVQRVSEIHSEGDTAPSSPRT